MLLHTIHGTLRVEGIVPGNSEKTLNLETADFHGFFIGSGLVLTHDNTVNKPTRCIVPGLAIHPAE